MEQERPFVSMTNHCIAEQVPPAGCQAGQWSRANPSLLPPPPRPPYLSDVRFWVKKDRPFGPGYQVRLASFSASHVESKRENTTPDPATAAAAGESKSKSPVDSRAKAGPPPLLPAWRRRDELIMAMALLEQANGGWWVGGTHSVVSPALCLLAARCQGWFRVGSHTTGGEWRGRRSWTHPKQP